MRFEDLPWPGILIAASVLSTVLAAPTLSLVSMRGLLFPATPRSHLLSESGKLVERQCFPESRVAHSPKLCTQAGGAWGMYLSWPQGRGHPSDTAKGRVTGADRKNSC